jgi:hypothetical protein
LLVVSEGIIFLVRNINPFFLCFCLDNHSFPVLREQLEINSQDTHTSSYNVGERIIIGLLFYVS